MMRPASKNILLALASSALTLLAAETVLRVHPPAWVYMSSRNIVQQTHSEPSANEVLQYVPKAGIEKPFTNREFKTTVKINSKNMRDREYALEKTAGVTRFAAVGDSFVFGWGVENDETVTELLERGLASAEVLNFGVSGYSGIQQVETVRARAAEFGPDTVLFFTGGLPAAAHDQYRFKNGKMQWADIPDTPLERVRGFLNKHVYLWSCLDVFLMTKINYLLYDFRIGRTRPQYMSEDYERYARERFEQGKAVMNALKQAAASIGAGVVVVYFPVKEELRDGLTPEDRQALTHFETFCRGQGWGFLDLTAALAESARSGNDPYFHYDDHWNRQGHRAAARAVREYLEKGGYANAPAV